VFCALLCNARRCLGLDTGLFEGNNAMKTLDIVAFFEVEKKRPLN